jgi:hypothetical protein
VPFPLLIVVPLLALKGALVGRFVYRDRLRARADRQFRCRVTRDGGSTGHIFMPIGTRDLVVYYESSSTANFVISRRGMKWTSGNLKEITDEDLKLIYTTLSAWARARGSTVVGFDAEPTAGRGQRCPNSPARRRIAKEGGDDVDNSTEFLASGDDRGELPVGCAERED